LDFSRLYLWHITAICLLFHSCKVMAEITMEQIIGRHMKRTNPNNKEKITNVKRILHEEV